MKIILVTGGNRGIGKEICRQLHDLGHTVILGSRDLEKGVYIAGSIGKNVHARQLDVTDEAITTQLFASVQNEFGKLDVLINNAGVGPNNNQQKKSLLAKTKNYIEKHSAAGRFVIQKSLPLLKKMGVNTPKEMTSDICLSEVKEIMDTNLYGAWRMIQLFIPLLLKSGDGRIINMSSGMGELQNLTGASPAYSLSKSSLNALTIMFSNELKEKGIKINAMCPGWVKTDMGGPNATREVSEGADTAVWLATIDNIPTGKFFRDRKEINW